MDTKLYKVYKPTREWTWERSMTKNSYATTLPPSFYLEHLYLHNQLMRNMREDHMHEVIISLLSFTINASTHNNLECTIKILLMRYSVIL